MVPLITVFAAELTVRAQSQPAPSPTPDPSPSPSLESQFFKNMLRDQKAIWTSPLHLKADDAKWAVPLGLGTMALITTDRITGDEIAESDRSLTASKIVSYAGSVYAGAAVAGTFYLVGRKAHDARARETGILTAEAALNSGIVVTALKAITQRGRPQTGVDRSEFLDGGSSFPSGHSALAWSVATVIANEYHEHRMTQVAVYGIASAVSVARFTGEKHYLSDVLVGSLIGYGIGQYVYKTHHQSENSTTSGKITQRWPAIAAHYNRRTRQYGVGLSWSF